MLSNAMVVAANMGCMSKKISVRSPLVTCAYIILVGGFKHLLFSISYIYIWDVILPIDELIFLMVKPPLTSNNQIFDVLIPSFSH